MMNDFLTMIASRQSVRPKYLADPAPDAEVLQKAVEAACSAPDHGCLKPWRFVAVSEDKRAALGELFEAAARRLGGDDEKAAKAKSKAVKGPGLVAFVVCIDPESKIPTLEQTLTAGAALENFLLALNAQGFGGIVLSGSVLKDEEVQKAFCKRPGETLAAWVTVGTPVEGAFKGRTPIEELPLSNW